MRQEVTAVQVLARGMKVPVVPLACAGAVILLLMMAKKDVPLFQTSLS